MLKLTAQTCNDWRVFPRAFSLLFAYLVFIVVQWFMHLPVPTTEQAAFASTIVASAAAWFKFYVESGNTSR